MSVEICEGCDLEDCKLRGKGTCGEGGGGSEKSIKTRIAPEDVLLANSRSGSRDWGEHGVGNDENKDGRKSRKIVIRESRIKQALQNSKYV